jgi:hypothetical protein
MPKVYFSKIQNGEDQKSISAKARTLFKAAGMNRLVESGRMFGVKTHFGEKGNTSYIPVDLIKPMIEEIKDAGGKPFFFETSALYTGRRSNAVDHFKTAIDHGFDPSTTGCPLIFIDGLKGNHDVEIEVKLKHFDTISVAGDFPLIPGALIITHPTGHDLAGFGGAIKNLAMGIASRAGKMQQHDAGKPSISGEKCTACGTCARWCPVDAIKVEQIADIDYELCIGCGQCLAVCPEEAVNFAWSERPENFNEKMAEFAYGICSTRKNRLGYVSFLYYVTDDCNCSSKHMDRICPDIGILASYDPLAIDQATIDLINKESGKDLLGKLWPDSHYEAQFRHAEEIGLGSREYELEGI